MGCAAKGKTMIDHRAVERAWSLRNVVRRLEYVDMNLQLGYVRRAAELVMEAAEHFCHADSRQTFAHRYSAQRVFAALQMRQRRVLDSIRWLEAHRLMSVGAVP